MSISLHRTNFIPCSSQSLKYFLKQTMLVGLKSDFLYYSLKSIYPESSVTENIKKYHPRLPSDILNVPSQSSLFVLIKVNKKLTNMNKFTEFSFSYDLYKGSGTNFLQREKSKFFF